jgi:hypothetical protein
VRTAIVLALLGLHAGTQAVPDPMRVFPATTRRDAVVKLWGPADGAIEEWSFRTDDGIARAIVQFQPDGIVRRVDLFFRYPISRDNAVARYHLAGETARTTIDGRRVEYFLSNEMLSLNYAAATEQSGVAGMTRYAPGDFQSRAFKHPHVRTSRHDDARLTGTVLSAYRVDSAEQCDRDCGATRECLGYSVAPPSGETAGAVCSLMSRVGEVVRAPGHLSVTYW